MDRSLKLPGKLAKSLGRWHYLSAALILFLGLGASHFATKAPDTGVTFVVLGTGGQDTVTTLNSLAALKEGTWQAIVLLTEVHVSLQNTNGPVPGLPSYLFDLQRYENHTAVAFHRFPVADLSPCNGAAKSFAMGLVSTPLAVLLREGQTVSEDLLQHVKKDFSSTRAAAIVYGAQHAHHAGSRAARAPNYILALRKDACNGKQACFDESGNADANLLKRLAGARHPVASVGMAPGISSSSSSSTPILGTPALPEVSCAVRSSVTTDNFVFTEERSRYFQDNIDSFKVNLKYALEKGCLPTAQSERIHVAFDARARSASPVYIQVQLEQSKSPFFNDQYFKKLASVAQVWDFSHQQAVDFKAMFSHAFFMPTTTYLSAEKPIFACEEDYLVEDREYGFNYYKDGHYMTCFMKNGLVNVTMVRRSVSKRPPEETPFPPPYKVGDTFQFDIPDILYYGQMERSSDNLRERTCDAVAAAGMKVMCVQNLFGPLLRHTVCRTKVVLVNQYYPDAQLGTHRIDPLLLAGTKVVAMQSADRVLDAEYAPAVTFATWNTLITVVKRALEEQSEGEVERVRAYMANRVSNLGPLCHALVSLPDR